MHTKRITEKRKALAGSTACDRCGKKTTAATTLVVPGDVRLGLCKDCYQEFRAFLAIKQITEEMKALALSPRYKKRCPLCKRPGDDPALYSRIERVLSTAANPLAAFMRFHDYAGKGSVPSLTDAFVNFLCPGSAPRKLDWGRFTEAMFAFQTQEMALAGLLVAHVADGLSLRALARQLESDDKTVARLVGLGKERLVALCNQFGVFPKEAT